MPRSERKARKAPRPGQREIKSPSNRKLQRKGKEAMAEYGGLAGAAKKVEAFCSEDAEG